MTMRAARRPVCHPIGHTVSGSSRQALGALLLGEKRGRG